MGQAPTGAAVAACRTYSLAQESDTSSGALEAICCPAYVHIQCATVCICAATHLPMVRRVGERAAAAADRRAQRKEQKELLEELLPRATAGTREARVRGGRTKGGAAVHGLPRGGEGLGLG